jgi:single-strand DNA-binding protein
MSNVFTFTGTVGRDAEVRFLPSGQAVLNVTVANNVGFGDKQKTNWVRVALWGKRAEGKLQEYLKKGQTVFCSGELIVEEYQGNDGSTKSQLVLNANILDLVGGRKEGGQSQPQQQSRPQQRPAQNRQQQAPMPDDFDDQIPF